MSPQKQQPHPKLENFLGGHSFADHHEYGGATKCLKDMEQIKLKLTASLNELDHRGNELSGTIPKEIAQAVSVDFQSRSQPTKPKPSVISVNDIAKLCVPAPPPEPPDAASRCVMISPSPQANHQPTKIKFISVNPFCVKADCLCFIAEENEKDIEKTTAKLAICKLNPLLNLLLSQTHLGIILQFQ